MKCTEFRAKIQATLDERAALRAEVERLRAELAAARRRPEWYENTDNIAVLLRLLRCQAARFTVDRCIEIVERPWRWTTEWEEYCRENEADAPALAPREDELPPRGEP